MPVTKRRAVDQLAVPVFGIAGERHQRTPAASRMFEDDQRVEPHDAAVAIAVAVAGAAAAVGDVAHDRAGIAADLFADLPRAGIVRVEAFGKFAHAFASACLIAASTRVGVAGTVVTSTPVAWRMALRIAGAVGISTCSPSPLAPNGPSGSATST